MLFTFIGNGGVGLVSFMEAGGYFPPAFHRQTCLPQFPEYRRFRCSAGASGDAAVGFQKRCSSARWSG